jgi:hypothetical protein
MPPAALFPDAQNRLIRNHLAATSKTAKSSLYVVGCTGCVDIFRQYRRYSLFRLRERYYGTRQDERRSRKPFT